MYHQRSIEILISNALTAGFAQIQYLDDPNIRLFWSIEIIYDYPIAELGFNRIYPTGIEIIRRRLLSPTVAELNAVSFPREYDLTAYDVDVIIH